MPLFLLFTKVTHQVPGKLMCLSLWAALYYDILDEKIRTQEIAPDFLLAWETKHFLCFLGSDFQLRGVSTAWPELPFSAVSLSVH